MVKNTRKKVGNSNPPVRKIFWVASLALQFAALVIIGLLSRHFGVIGLGAIIILTVGLIFLTRSTVDIIKGTTTDESIISTLGILHIIFAMIALFIVVGNLSIISNLPF